VTEVSIKVTGLKEFSRSLRKIDSEAPKQLRLLGNRIAQVVVREAQTKIPSGPPARGHVSSSIRASSTRTAVRVSGGGKRFPYYGWLEFGGAVGIKKSVRRPVKKEGRYIWPAFVANKARLQADLRTGLVETAKSAGFEAS